jgi:hypothetical protein
VALAVAVSAVDKENVDPQAKSEKLRDIRLARIFESEGPALFLYFAFSLHVF